MIETRTEIINETEDGSIEFATIEKGYCDICGEEFDGSYFLCKPEDPNDEESFDICSIKCLRTLSAHFTHKKLITAVTNLRKHR